MSKSAFPVSAALMLDFVLFISILLLAHLVVLVSSNDIGHKLVEFRTVVIDQLGRRLELKLILAIGIRAGLWSRD